MAGCLLQSAKKSERLQILYWLLQLDSEWAELARCAGKDSRLSPWTQHRPEVEPTSGTIRRTQRTYRCHREGRVQFACLVQPSPCRVPSCRGERPPPPVLLRPAATFRRELH